MSTAAPTAPPRDRTDLVPERYAKDPVCGMQVERDNPGATTEHDGHTVYFCADRCKDQVRQGPPEVRHRLTRPGAHDDR